LLKISKLIQQVAFFKQRLAFFKQAVYFFSAKVACRLYHNGQVSSAAIVSMGDNVKHAKWKVAVKKLSKRLLGS
jgi:hypothetical protein